MPSRGGVCDSVLAFVSELSLFHKVATRWRRWLGKCHPHGLRKHHRDVGFLGPLYWAEPRGKHTEQDCGSHCTTSRTECEGDRRRGPCPPRDLHSSIHRRRKHITTTSDLHSNGARYKIGISWTEGLSRPPFNGNGRGRSSVASEHHQCVTGVHHDRVRRHLAGPPPTSQPRLGGSEQRRGVYGR